MRCNNGKDRKRGQSITVSTADMETAILSNRGIEKRLSDEQTDNQSA